MRGGGSRHRRWEVGTKVGVRTWGFVGCVQLSSGQGPQELREVGEDGWDQGVGGGGGLGEWWWWWKMWASVPRGPSLAAAGKSLCWARPGGCDLCSLSGSRVPCPHLPSHLLSDASFPDPLRILPPELRSLGHALLSASPLHCHVTHSLWLPLLPNPRPYTAYFMDKCVLCGCLS